jgi:hypothetical protein
LTTYIIKASRPFCDFYKIYAPARMDNASFPGWIWLLRLSGKEKNTKPGTIFVPGFVKAAGIVKGAGSRSLRSVRTGTADA